MTSKSDTLKSNQDIAHILCYERIADAFNLEHREEGSYKTLDV
ncbi:hypothetical protein A8U91_00454 [Halomonas elongata]|uniref:Uncharacterized protein n=1 Tax=Halomonas elongata TaxID=2746 RepID=A0A1B8P1L6_HALEL|nr:hypothetical protein A8U91_00454 [Halomonas elongata]